MARFVNLVKLCVGAEKVEDLIDWQHTRAALNPDGLPHHITRMWPKRAAEVVNGGSIYWVFKGVLLARQRVLRLDEAAGADGILRCAIVMDPAVIRTEPVPKRAFQGWRYMEAADSPRDLAKARLNEEALPPSLVAALADLGVR